ncbi:MAG: glucose-1-phosphate adenylyltransferase [Clostridia bacterium]|nr:glucose-1-phosphate adenylyltransferase [Clostridia bacterium]
MIRNKKRCVAMILAGGQGSRLGVLTKYRAKPAVPFGGKYRIIDFTLSNCTNSGIDTVGVLTQYEPLELNSYIGSGAAWDLDSVTGGTFVLPPYMAKDSGRWYSGTADAIRQNVFFIDLYDPDYVLVLSGDHVYQMDYNKMIRAHREKGADVTIAVLKVPLSEAHRFGVMMTDGEGRVTEFAEKPKEPKSDLASMGIYVFSWKKLKEYLKKDAEDENSDNDFGKNVLPAMLSGGEKLYAYRFSGYWKDVGTIESLWEANMELLDSRGVNLWDKDLKVYARNPNKPPHYVGFGAEVRNSMIAEGCNVYGKVEHSVLFPGVTVKEGACVRDSVIMQDAVIEENSTVIKTIIDEDTKILEGARVGGDGEITVLGANVTVEAGAVIPEGGRTEPKSTVKKG